MINLGLERAAGVGESPQGRAWLQPGLQEGNIQLLRMEVILLMMDHEFQRAQ